MFQTTPHFWRDRFQASGVHFCISLVIALAAALLVFALWYPYPYREISGGRELFLIVVTVDVILGPLITLAVFNRTKPMAELRRDLTIVALLQLGALGYGLWSVFVARPVHLVFEYDRFRVVHAIDVPEELLAKAPPDLDAMPLTGPTTLALREFHDEAEKMSATLAALKGVSLASRPDLWQSYAAARARVLAAAKPLGALQERFAQRRGDIDAVVAKTGRPASGLVYLPMVGRKAFWTVLLDATTAQVLAFIPLDSF